MNKKLIIPKQIITVDKDNTILKNHAVEITDNRISQIKKTSEFDKNNFDGEIVNSNNYTLIPGFVQTHIHLCQSLFRGLADDLELLDWLQHKIFPFENAHDKNSLRISTQLGINELLLGGTTTILDMGTLNHQEVIFEELKKSGMRAFAGKCMMDINDLMPEFKSSTKDELKISEELAKEFHQKENGRINYAFAPRFALSCSEELLKETGKMINDFPGSLFHTHSSENKSEIEQVRKKYNKENVELFNTLDILNDHTVLAHCIHLSETEINLLKTTETRVAHCPSSNLKLGSGVARIPLYLQKGINVSLGADGPPCNNNLSAFMEMRMAALIQKPIHGPTAMDALTVFRLATIEGAKALHIADQVGSIEVGKKADLVLLDLETPYNTISPGEENIYSDIVYSSFNSNVKHVMADGKWLVKNGVSTNYNDEDLTNNAEEELGKLLNRIN